MTFLTLLSGLAKAAEESEHIDIDEVSHELEIFEPPRFEDYHRPLKGEEDKDALKVLESMSFYDFIIARNSFKKFVYLKALSMRPELQDINWREKDAEVLASQLDHLTLIEPDPSYHLKLGSAFRSMMRMIKIDPEQIYKVQSFLTDWNKLKRRKQYVTRKCFEDDFDERILREREKRWQRRQAQIAEQDKGRDLPLLYYICEPLSNEDGSLFPANEILEIALKYRDMYRCSRAFACALRQLLQELHYDKSVFRSLCRSRRTSLNRKLQAKRVQAKKSNNNGKEAHSQDLHGDKACGNSIGQGEERSVSSDEQQAFDYNMELDQDETGEMLNFHGHDDTSSSSLRHAKHISDNLHQFSWRSDDTDTCPDWESLSPL